jgi:stearoyl-CoA desaturase (delta-9 desaturase)
VLIALLTMGEGWHNNHHYYQASARQGFFWWEVDASYYLLKVGSWLGIVKHLRTPPARVLDANRVKQGAFDVGMFKAYWGKANKAVVRSQVGQIVHEGRVSASDALTSATDALAERKEALEEFVLSSLESAEELARAARVGQRDLAADA